MDKKQIYEIIKQRHKSENQNMSLTTQSTRLYVIETTIYIEELISETLGFLLGFDSKTSNSLGTKSTSLSFNQKVTIIQDMKNVESIMIQKMNCLMQIRNKFAHVSNAADFEGLFENVSNGKSIRKELVKWYGETKVIEDYSNQDFIKLFDELTDDVISFLCQITGDYFYDLGFEEGKGNFRIKLLDGLIKEILQLEGGRAFVNKVIDDVENELIKEK